MSADTESELVLDTAEIRRDSQADVWRVAQVTSRLTLPEADYRNKRTQALCDALDKARAEIARLTRLMPPSERGPGIIGEGSWSVFAAKVLEERDEAREVRDALRKERDALCKECDALYTERDALRKDVSDTACAFNDAGVYAESNAAAALLVMATFRGGHRELGERLDKAVAELEYELASGERLRAERDATRAERDALRKDVSDTAGVFKVAVVHTEANTNAAAARAVIRDRDFAREQVQELREAQKGVFHVLHCYGVADTNLAEGVKRVLRHARDTYTEAQRELQKVRIERDVLRGQVERATGAAEGLKYLGITRSYENTIRAECGTKLLEVLKPQGIDALNTQPAVGATSFQAIATAPVAGSGQGHRATCGCCTTDGCPCRGGCPSE